MDPAHTLAPHGGSGTEAAGGTEATSGSMAAGRTASHAPAGERPLLVTRDQVLLDALLRLAAAAGVTPDVAADAVAARRLWSTAPLVVVAADTAGPLADGAPPRRPGVLVATRAETDLSLWQHALALGAERVLLLPDEEPALIGRLADTVDARGHTGITVAVVGGCGGAGASTFAAGLGVAAARRGGHALLLDADPLGGGLDLVLGSESAAGVRWPDLIGTTGRVSATSLREALPRLGALSVLSWDRGDLRVVPPLVMREVLAAGGRGHDVVVVDLPRRLDPAGEEVLLQADATYLVVPAEVRAVAAAGRVAAQLAAVTAHVALVVRGPGPAGLDGRLVSDTLELPLVGEMRPERGIDAALDLGEGLWRRRRGALARCCARVLDQALSASEPAVRP